MNFRPAIRPNYRRPPVRRRRPQRWQLLVGLFLLAVLIIASWQIWRSRQQQPVATSDPTLDQDLTGLTLGEVLDWQPQIAGHYPITANETVNAVIKQFVDETVSDFRRHDDPQSELNFTFDVARLNEDIIGFHFKVYQIFSTAANGLETQHTFTFNLRDARQYQLADFFETASDDYLSSLSEQARAQLLKLSVYDQEFERELLLDGTTPQAENFDQFIFSNQGLTIFFDLYQISTRAAGVDQVTLALNDLPGLKRELWSNTADNLPPPPPPSPPIVTPVPTTFTDLTGKKLLALTFDDGPSDTTARLLDTLGTKGVRATFFVLGSRVAFYPDLVRRLASSGHQIGNHTFSHRDLTKLSSEAITKEIETAAAAIAALTGVSPSALRPPYGAVNESVKQLASVPIINWSIDPEDWRYRQRETVVQNVVTKAADGAIILLHDLYSSTIDAVPEIIDTLHDQGYTFVTVDELLAARSRRENGRVYTSLPPPRDL